MRSLYSYIQMTCTLSFENTAYISIRHLNAFIVDTANTAFMIHLFVGILRVCQNTLMYYTKQRHEWVFVFVLNIFRNQCTSNLRAYVKCSHLISCERGTHNMCTYEYIQHVCMYIQFSLGYIRNWLICVDCARWLQLSSTFSLKHIVLSFYCIVTVYRTNIYMVVE